MLRLYKTVWRIVPLFPGLLLVQAGFALPCAAQEPVVTPATLNQANKNQAPLKDLGVKDDFPKEVEELGVLPKLEPLPATPPSPGAPSQPAKAATPGSLSLPVPVELPPVAQPVSPPPTAAAASPVILPGTQKEAPPLLPPPPPLIPPPTAAAPVPVELPGLAPTPSTAAAPAPVALPPIPAPVPAPVANAPASPVALPPVALPHVPAPASAAAPLELPNAPKVEATPPVVLPSIPSPQTATAPEALPEPVPDATQGKGRKKKKDKKSDGKKEKPEEVASASDSGKKDKRSRKERSRDVLNAIPSGTSSLPVPVAQESVKIDHTDPGMPLTTEAAGAAAPSALGITMQSSQSNLSTQQLLEEAYQALINNQAERAVSMYSQVIAREPKNELALFGLATTYQRVGQRKRAMGLYETLLTTYPNHSEGMNNYLLLMADEEPAEARRQLETLERRTPEFAPVVAQLGMLYYKSGDLQNASKRLGKAIALEPDNLIYRYNMAVVQDKLGNAPEAVKLYALCLDAGYKGAMLPDSLDKIQRRLTFLRSK